MHFREWNATNKNNSFELLTSGTGFVSASLLTILIEISYSRLETGRDHWDADCFPAGEEGRRGVHLHRGEQCGPTGGRGLPQGHRPAPGPAASQSDISCRPGGGQVDMLGLRGPAS